jgi:LEA14-like dessication related protein
LRELVHRPSAGTPEDDASRGGRAGGEQGVALPEERFEDVLEAGVAGGLMRYEARRRRQCHSGQRPLEGDPSMSMRPVNRSVAAIAAGLLLAGTTGCSLIEKPTASIAGVRVQDINLTDATMLFDVKVDNPYTVPLPMSNVDYALTSQGQQFLTGKADVQGTVPAGASKTLGVPVRINYLKLIDAVKGARPGAAIPYTADMGLSVDVPALGPLRIPMSREGELSIPSAPGLLERLKGLTK